MEKPIEVFEGVGPVVVRVEVTRMGINRNTLIVASMIIELTPGMINSSALRALPGGVGVGVG